MSTATDFDSSELTQKSISARKALGNEKLDEEIVTRPRNFLLLACYQIVMRIGWIFKTESIVMPAVLDLMGGATWMRACLPMLNRFGQSVPPLIAAPRVRATPLKKRILVATTLLMGFVFLGLAGIWAINGDSVPWWVPLIFLFAYSLFFISVGVNQLVLGTLQGKLINVRRRGRFMLFSSSVGATLAVIAVIILLDQWLWDTGGNFAAIFGFAGSMFVLSAFVAAFLGEHPDKSHPPQKTIQVARALRETLRTDSNFRLVVFTACLFGMSMTLFPHYQALGRERLGLGLQSLLVWVVVQNAGLAIASFPIGWMADRYGNRLTLKVLVAGITATPLIALFLSNLGGSAGSYYFLVFIFVGLTPVTIKIFNNYTLELVPRDRQPQYLSLLSLFMAGPAIFTSVIVGFLLDWFGYDLVFLMVASIVFVGWLLCFKIKEPRDSH